MGNRSSQSPWPNLNPALDKVFFPRAGPTTHSTQSNLFFGTPTSKFPEKSAEDSDTGCGLEILEDQPLKS